MMFSASMSAVEYYFLDRFPVPYGKNSSPPPLSLSLALTHMIPTTCHLIFQTFAALYLTVVAFFSAIVGQRMVRKVINWLGRASIIIFTLSIMIFLSTIPLGTLFSPPRPSPQMIIFDDFNTYIIIIQPCVIRRWNRYRELDWQDWATWVHGIRRHMQVWCIGGR